MISTNRDRSRRRGWRRTSVLSVLLIVLYLAFWAWYTPLRGPLDAAEVDHYVGLFADSGSDEDGQARLRKFLEEDTGNDFVMVNLIEYRNPPTQVEGVKPGETAQEVLAKYMEYMWPALLKRACHPMFMGSPAAGALDLWGVEGGRDWSQAAGMRYRSRRDMMEIATNPAFQGRHDFKTAAMAKTIAFPVDPWASAGDPRLILGLLLAIALLVLRLLAGRTRST